MANEAMELQRMASQADQEASYLEAENSKMEMELKKLEKVLFSEIKRFTFHLPLNFDKILCNTTYTAMPVRDGTLTTQILLK